MATGHLRKRGTQGGLTTYQVVVESERDPTTGKRERKYKTVKGTKKQAEAVLKKMLADLDAGEVLAPSSQRVEHWMEEWLRLYRPDLQETTRTRYQDIIRLNINPVLGKVPLKDLKPTQVQAWLNDLSQKDELSPKTVRNIFNVFNPAMEKAVELSMLTRNPCKGATLPKLVKYEAQVYDTNQIQQVLALTEGTDLHLFVLLGLTVGLRRGEMLGLKWKHVDFEKSTISIEETRVNANGKVITKMPKTKAGKRTIAVGANVLDALKAGHRAYQLRCLERGVPVDNEGFVVCKPNGQPYAPDSLSQKWERFLKENNLPKIRLHDTRHSCTTAMLSAGIDHKTVSKHLGHADVYITLNTYAHSTPAMEKAAAEKLDNLIFAKASND